MPDSILFIKQRLWVCYLFYFEVGSHIVQASQERLYLPNARIIRSMCGLSFLTPFYLFLKDFCVCFCSLRCNSGRPGTPDLSCLHL